MKVYFSKITFRDIMFNVYFNIDFLHEKQLFICHK